MDFSVLMSLYSKESSSFLDESLASVFNQSQRATEVVLVEDGPLPLSLYDIIEKYQNKFPELKIVKLEKNQGLGKALNEGLKSCHYDLVVRMDTDDICKPDRFEKQISYMEVHTDVDVCSAWIDEFVDTPNIILSTRKVPESHIDIFEFGKRRNPINHPVCVFRKSKVEEVGGYQHFMLFEDYYLWARMLVHGAKFYNLQEPLLYFRRTPQTFRRRGGWKYAIVELKFQYKLYKIGYIGIEMVMINSIIRFLIRIVPNNVRNIVYSKLLRK